MTRGGQTPRGGPTPRGGDPAVVLTELAEAVFALCDEVTTVTVAAWGEGSAAPPSSDLGIDDVCRAALAEAPVPLAGVGVVMAPGVLADREHWLRWWQPSPDGPRPLRIQLDPNALDFRDYTTLPWFVTPRTTGARHVTGPYVDYLCTDCYTLTFTTPLHVDGRFLGVAGADVLVHHLETQLVGRVDVPDGTEWVAVSDTGRVVTAVDSDVMTGDLLLPSDGGPEWDDAVCPGLPWTVRTRRMER